MLICAEFNFNGPPLATRYFHTGLDDQDTVWAAINLAISLNALARWVETKDLVRKALPAAHRSIGRDDEYTLKLEKALLKATHEDKGSSLDELRKAISMCEGGYRRARRVYGDSHPITAELARELDLARDVLAERTQS